MRFCVMMTALAVSTTVYADSWSSEGELTLEGRAFLPLVDGVDNYNLSMSGRLEIGYKNKPFKAKARIFARADANDDIRSAMFPEELWLEYKKSKLRLIVGYQLENWSATEVFHPADVLNSRFLDGDIQYPEKIGELMATARLKFWDGNIEAFFMPLFTEPIFPSPRSRFRFSAPGQTLGESRYTRRNGEVTDERWQLAWATRLQYRFEKIDVSFHALQMLDKVSPLVMLDTAGGAPLPRLLYAPMTQFGGTAQIVAGSLLIKAEGSYKFIKSPENVTLLTEAKDHGFAVLGLEYGIVHKKGGTSTLIAEGQALLGQEPEDMPFVLFTRHAMLGWRYEFGDAQSSTLLTTVIADVTDPERLLIGTEFSRRLGGTWTLVLGARLTHLPASDPANKQGVDWLSGANQAYGKLTRYF